MSHRINRIASVALFTVAFLACKSEDSNAEPKPKGFAFSESAFRIFLLMASRRLQSDRFFTEAYTPETYTPVGLRWIEETSMSAVIRRHYPELSPAGNAFKRWPASTGP